MSIYERLTAKLIEQIEAGAKGGGMP